LIPFSAGAVGFSDILRQIRPTSVMHEEKAVILDQRPRAPRAFRLGMAAVAIGIPALGVVTAFGIAPGAAIDQLEQTLVREVLSLPSMVQATPARPRYSGQDRVLRGDTVAALFERMGVRDAAALDFLRTDSTGRMLFRQLVPGRVLHVETGELGELLTLRYFMSATNVLEVIRGEGGFGARQRALHDSPRIVYKSGVVRSSLFAATDAAGIPDAIAMQIARVFSTDIDFHTDLRKGDRFSLAYEMLYEAGEPVTAGRILAAEFVNDGRVYRAILFAGEEGRDAYYSPDGSSRAKAFLRSPLEFSRVSSGFGARFHPIFNKWRAHTGVDFAAPKGTRILAVADGTVVSASSRGGYGNAIEIKHGGGVTTLYAHLSGFSSGLRAGTRVQQAQPIGFVGATGWATGPHLHYEFKLAGMHQDPMKVPLPKAEPVPQRLRASFELAATGAGRTLDLIAGPGSLRFE
jgi:murein DD-endopeptidase MepM/ murein hydrolase activator NlpD